MDALLFFKQRTHQQVTVTDGRKGNGDASKSKEVKKQRPRATKLERQVTYSDALRDQPGINEVDFSFLVFPIETGKESLNLLDSMNKQQAATPESDSEEMEEVKKMEKTGGGGGETTKEYVIFRGDKAFVTEMNVVCLIGPVTGEEHFTVTVKRNYYLGEEFLHYAIGKSMKLGFLIKYYCDRKHFVKSNFQFTHQKTGKLVVENQTPEEFGMRHDDVILASLKEIWIRREIKGLNAFPNEQLVYLQK
ncbi:hypothetical protein K1719_029465 [Acacia pycnantha]|nr:hypothetical protein K1719_029465 [Acacia pycnantha]